MFRLTVVGALLLTAATARAQGFGPDVATLANDQPTVYILDSAGREFSGHLLRIDQQSLTIRNALGDVPFAIANVRTIDRRGDSLKNGAIVGAGVGLVLGALAAATSTCGGLLGPETSCSPSYKLGIVGVSTAMYAAIGVGIDALRHGRTRIYPVPKNRIALGIEPPSRRGRTGLNLSVGW
ncbi:MAG: hypothetical protein V7647_3604 [Acidobacteriota bacterium]